MILYGLLSLQLPYQFRLILLTVLLCIGASVKPAQAFSLLPSEIPPTPLSEWQPKAGDSLLVDTESNIGYLLDAEGEYTAFPVATGQKRIVSYIGRTYDAKTPDTSWLALSKEKKGDRITFGKLGRFLRLSKQDDDTLERTAYGIHSHAYANKMLAGLDRYRSMGCIIVTEEVLDRIIETFALNEESLSVKTVAGLGDESISYEVLKERMSAL